MTSKKNNKTELPKKLQDGLEATSGYSLADVKVSYNSTEPVQLQALAYAKGEDIHVNDLNEQQLPHEAWHVVQQKSGKVAPTIQLRDGVSINSDTELEKEADALGFAAVQMKKKD